MSAKDDISTALQASQYTSDQAEFLAQELYSAVARELAEKVRRPLTQAECMDIQSGVPLREVLARRIDPEVRNA